MVLRPPIETWTRPELEDHYHSVVEQLTESKKKCQELEKKLAQQNSRFRRTLLDRKSKDDAVVEREKYEEVQRDNQLLLMKLKSAKHQLLTYTTPSARPATASAMTCRTTYRLLSTVRRTPALNTNRPEVDTSRPSVVRISESNLAEKANVIKLNRLVRERNAQIAELQYQIERSSAQIHDLRAQLEQKSSEIAVLDSSRSENDVTSQNQATVILRQEIDIANRELAILKEANERLVKQSLCQDFNAGASETLELKKEIATLEERVREAERREKDAERRRREDRQLLQDEQKRNRQLASSNVSVPISHPAPINSDRSTDSPVSPIKKSRRKEKDDVLLRLYRDVAGIVDMHGDRSDDVIGEGLDHHQKMERWQRMYSELYNEMEKVRNMLLVQHNINQKQTTEITLLQEEMDRLKTAGEVKLEEMREKLAEKRRRILILEEQIRQIAYSGQKPIGRIGDTQVQDSTGISTELSIRIRSIQVSPRLQSMTPSFFLSLEFFDFELQTTPLLLSAVEQTTDYTTVYNVVVSALFVHYLESNGITVELYRPKGASFELLGAGMVVLTRIFEKKTPSVFGGHLSLKHVGDGTELADISYEVSLTQDLHKALAGFQRQEAAQKVLPLDIESEASDFETLTVVINRCSGLEKLAKDPFEVCVVYEFLSFSPFITDTVMSSKSAEFGSRRDWAIPAANIDKYLADTDITLFLVNPSVGGSNGVLAMVSLPLAPLVDGQSIRGAFPMIKADGCDSGAYLDVNVAWKNLPRFDRKRQKTELTKEPVVKEPTLPPPAVLPADLLSIAGGQAPPPAYSQREEYQREERIPSLAPSSPSVSQSSLEAEEPPLSESEGIISDGSNESSGTIILDEKDKTEQKKSEPTSAQQLVLPPVKPRQRSPPSSASSNDSKGTYTKEEDALEAKTSSPPELAASPRRDSVEIRESVRQRDANDIRSMLGELPPIAKPRLSKPPASFISPLDQPVSSSESEREESEGERRQSDSQRRRIEFSSPLHNSIPPSETSSLSSPPSRREKAAVPLPMEGGRSAMKHATRRFEFGSDGEDNSIVSIHIDKLYNVQFGPLTQRRFDGVKFYVDWTFLDFPSSECRVPGSETLPRSGDAEIVFDYRKDYHLSRKRVALLEQYVETRNRLEFTLLTDAGRDSEELAVGLLELCRVPTDEFVTISLLDINGIRYADLDIVLYYSPNIFETLNSSNI